MTVKFWRGDAAAVSQISTYTPASVTVGNIFTLTTNTGKTISFTATATTVANVVTGLKAALDLTTIPEFKEATWTDATTLLRATSTKAGRPFTITSSSADGAGSAGHSFTAATPTASSGPNHYGDVANWSPSGVPVDADDIDLSLSTSDILYDLNQATIDPASWTQPASYTGKIGLPAWNAGGYWEYRTRYLTYNSVVLSTFGQGAGAGSPRTYLNLGTAAGNTSTVYSTGNSESQSLPALVLAGSHGSNVLNVSKGNVGLAIEPGTTAQFPVIRIAEGGSVVAGAGCTLGGTATMGGGTFVFETNLTTLTKTGGTSTALKAATIGTFTQDAGTHYDQSSGTNTTTTCRGPQSIYDRSRDIRGKTFTNATFTGGAQLLDPGKTLTFTNPITVDTASVQKSNFGQAPYLLQRT